jgi:hypothetical protein
LEVAKREASSVPASAATRICNGLRAAELPVHAHRGAGLPTNQVRWRIVTGIAHGDRFPELHVHP